MADNIPNHVRDALKSAHLILLIDWASADIPRTLVNGGFQVFCHSPNGYTRAEVVNEYPPDVDKRSVFPGKDNEQGYLVFRPLQGPPGPVDIVNIYRRGEEHANIINVHALPSRQNAYGFSHGSPLPPPVHLPGQTIYPLSTVMISPRWPGR